MQDTNWEDLYQILGVDSEAGPDQISRAYRNLVMDYHPDRQVGATDAVRLLAEDKLKDINRAHNILGDQESRLRYHEDWYRRKSPPQLTVEPTILKFTDVPVGENRTASFTIRNTGGPYSGEPVVDLPAALWIEVTDRSRLDADNELPAKVEIRVTAEEVGASFSDTIKVRLDTQEVKIRVELQTRPAPTPTLCPQNSRPSSTYTSARPASSRSTFLTDNTGKVKDWVSDHTSNLGELIIFIVSLPIVIGIVVTVLSIVGFIVYVIFAIIVSLAWFLITGDNL